MSAEASEFRIRDFEPEDYERLAALASATYPDMPVSVEELRHEDESRPPQYLAHKIVSEVDGEMIGAARYDQIPWVHHPRKFFVHGFVAPGHRGRGLGATLFDAILRSLARHDPLAIRASVRESQKEGIAFVAARGFNEERRAWESELELTSFDAARFAHAEEGVTGSGISIRTLAELALTDPDWQRNYYGLTAESGRDSPRLEPYTYPTFEEYRRIHFESPVFMPEGTFVALDGDEYVGSSDLHRRGGESHL
ncbi:MAG TPA: GNAT family N-acetyltransferase, partial [Thermoplasmata archaeon]|nr:GNAT family N-acetyltransferase [Thermoplasmata archaeon]